VFGGELWFKICLDLFNKFMRGPYKSFILESLDTDGKSGAHFLELLENIIEETKSFLRYLKKNIFKENNLDFESEIENIFNLIFSE